MKKLHLCACVALYYCTSITAARAEFLDQMYMAPVGTNAALIVGSTQTLAQTFTVGRAGILSRVEVDVARGATLPPGGMTLEVRRWSGGGSQSGPGSAVGSIAAIDVPTSFGWLGVDLTPFALGVTEGEVWSIVLSSSVRDQGGLYPFGWRGVGPGSYARGDLYFDRGTGYGRTLWDLGFRTFVTAVPEPSGLALATVGACVLLGFRHWRGRSAGTTSDGVPAGAP